MSRPGSLLAAAIGFPLVLAACGDDTVPPSGPGAEVASAPAVRASARATSRFRFQVKDRAANASFSSLDPSGCVETFVFVFGSNETLKEGPGKPASGPLAVVRLSQFDFCNNTVGEFFGFAEDATFEVSRKLDQARLKATVPGFADETGLTVSDVERAASAVSTVALETPIGEDGATLADFIADDESPDTVAEVEARVLAEAVHRALAELPELHRTALELRFGMTGEPPATVSYIAGVVDMPEHQVRQLIADATKELAEKLAHIEELRAA